MSGDVYAVFVPAKCTKTGKDFFIRYDWGADHMWVRTYGVLSTANSGGSKSSATVDLNNSRVGPQYKCPHCGNALTFYCNRCGTKVPHCYDGSGTWYCPVTKESGSGWSKGTTNNLSGNVGDAQ